MPMCVHVWQLCQVWRKGLHVKDAEPQETERASFLIPTSTTLFLFSSHFSCPILLPKYTCFSTQPIMGSMVSLGHSCMVGPWALSGTSASSLQEYGEPFICHWCRRGLGTIYACNKSRKKRTREMDFHLALSPQWCSHACFSIIRQRIGEFLTSQGLKTNEQTDK